DEGKRLDGLHGGTRKDGTVDIANGKQELAARVADGDGTTVAAFDHLAAKKFYENWIAHLHLHRVQAPPRDLIVPSDYRFNVDGAQLGHYRDAWRCLVRFVTAQHKGLAAYHAGRV